jgi:hypothetical protein
MRLRTVLLFTSAAGAIGALLLAFDIHHRFQFAQRESIVSGVTPGTDSIQFFGEAYMLGLVSLAFLFTGIFLMIVSNSEKALRPERKTKPAVPAAAAIPVAPAPQTAPATPAPAAVAPVAVAQASAPVPPEPAPAATEVAIAEVAPAAAAPVSDPPPSPPESQKNPETTTTT